MNWRKGNFKTTGSRWLELCIRAACGIALIPILINRLGVTEFGMTVFLMSVIAILQLGELGMSNALTRQLTLSRTNNEDKKFKEFFSTGFCFFTVVSLIMGVIGMGILYFASIDGERISALQVILFGGFSVSVLFFSYLKHLYGAVFASIRKLHIHYAISGIQVLGQFCLILAVFEWFGASIASWMAATVISHMLTALACKFLTAWWEPMAMMSVRHVTFSAVKEIYPLARNLFSVRIATYLSIRASPILIGVFIGSGALAFFAPAQRISNLVSSFVNGFIVQLNPAATRSFASKNIQDSREILIEGSRNVIFLAVMFYSPLLFFPDLIIHMWLADALGEGTETAVYLMMASSLLLFSHALGGTQSATFLAFDRTIISVWFSVPFAVIDFAGTLFLLMTTDLGPIAIFIFPVITSFLRRPFVSLIALRLLELPFWRSNFSVLAAPALAFMSSAMLAYLIRENFQWLPGRWTAFYLLAFYFIGTATFCCLFSFIQKRTKLIFKDFPSRVSQNT